MSYFLKNKRPTIAISDSVDSEIYPTEVKKNQLNYFLSIKES